MRLIATDLTIMEARRVTAAVTRGPMQGSGCYPVPTAGSGGLYDLALPCHGCSSSCRSGKEIERRTSQWCAGYIAAIREESNAALSEARAK